MLIYNLITELNHVVHSCLHGDLFRPVVPHSFNHGNLSYLDLLLLGQALHDGLFGCLVGCFDCHFLCFGVPLDQAHDILFFLLLSLFLDLFG